KGVAVPPELVPLAIDELPVLFIAAAGAEGETVFTGAAELRVKESDRLAVMSEGLTRVGVPNELLPDGLRILGGQRLRAGAIDCHSDRRIAMSFAVASLLADEPLLVRDVENLASSFPGSTATAAACGLSIADA